MKKMYVLDASVLIKWFSDEEFTYIALKLRDDFFKGNIGSLGFSVTHISYITQSNK